MAGRSPIFSRPPRGRGFTLVELLVVITIIGILVAMLVPAVQYAREMGRRNDCMSHLGQLAKGALLHESHRGFFPSGGWGWCSIGDPDRGYGATQPGGWFYSILPFIEQLPLHDLGVNIPYKVGNASDPGTQTRMQLAAQMVETPLVVANCPTRRRPVQEARATYVIMNYSGGALPLGGQGLGRTDYAACCGDVPWSATGAGPPDPGFGVITVPPSPYYGCSASFTGVCYSCSEIAAAQLTGGVNNTILLGEKACVASDYFNGLSARDNECQYVGMDDDINRSTSSLPLRDCDTIDPLTLFGSAHYASCNFVFCDSSVRGLSYSIDLATFQQLGRRVKTQVVDETKIK